MVRSRIHTTKRRFLEAVAEGNTEGAKAAFAEAAKLIDSAASKGVYHSNTADRKKSRMHRALNGMVQGASAE